MRGFGVNPPTMKRIFGGLGIVVFGLLLSLPLVVWGSGVLSKLMNRFPAFVWVGGGVLGWVAMKMITDDPFVIKWLGAWLSTVHHVGPYLLAALIAAFGWWCARATPVAKTSGEPAP